MGTTATGLRSRADRSWRLAWSLALIGLAGLFAAAPASAAFGIAEFDGEVIDRDGGGNAIAATQAASHPDEARATIEFNSVANPVVGTVPDGNVRDIRVDLPRGFSGNPLATPRCNEADLDNGDLQYTACPFNTQIGTVRVTAVGLLTATRPLFNMQAPDDVPGLLGFRVGPASIHLRVGVRTESDYGLTVVSANTSQAAPLVRVEVTIWGNPADPAHDEDRGTMAGTATTMCSNTTDPACSNPFTAQPRAFVSTPVVCDGPVETTLDVTGWQGGAARSSFMSHLPAPDQATLVGPDGCEDVPFFPSLSGGPSNRVAGKPSGFGFDLAVPRERDDEPAWLVHGYPKRVSVTLPEGVRVSPSSAHGLEACAPDEIKLGTRARPTCPQAARIGTVVVTTPVLAQPLKGGLYLAKPYDNPFRSLLALYIVAEGSGVLVKLPGEVKADAVTGRLETTFDNNPQLPFSKLELDLKDGERAPLVNPRECGAYSIESSLSSWSGQSVDSPSDFRVDQGCVPAGFAPSFVAGAANPTAGAFSPLSVSFARGDLEQELSGVEVALPKGSIARLAGVPLCSSGDAATGACPDGSRIGTVTVGAGAGSSPFYIGGQPVYLTEGYKGAPYGLAVVVHAVAGPFDLGKVVVRQAIHIDPETAELRVVSDPLPTILEGIPLQVRDVRVKVDRPGFSINPTDCTPAAIAAKLSSTGGAVASGSNRFQVGDCGSLEFRPQVAMRLTGKGQTKTGRHPGLTTVVTQKAGQANIGRAKVTLPRSIALDANNSYDKALVCDYDKAQKADCPASTIIGSATADTPVLNRLLSGPVHLVQGIKFGPEGNRIRTTPALLVKLRGEVAINLRGQTTTERGTNRLTTTFAAVPDAPVSRFSLRIAGGKKGILAVTRTARSKIDVCASRQVAAVELDGQNGKAVDHSTTVRTPCGKAAKRAARRAAKRDRRR